MVDDPSHLVVAELFLSGRERARGEEEGHTDRSYASDRERGRNAHATLTTRFVEEGNEERKKRKKDGRNAAQRSAARRSADVLTYERTNKRSFHFAADYSTSRIRSSIEGEPRKIRSID